MMYTCSYQSPLGAMLLACEETALTGVWFEGQVQYARGLTESQKGTSLLLRRTARWLDAYFAGENPPVDIPLRLAGTDFQQEVWAILSTIPYGQTTTYGAIARQMAARRGLPSFSAQAVGGAVGRNPISILIPCHRVIGAKGALTGYAGGLEKKIVLLQLEGVSAILPSRYSVGDRPDIRRNVAEK